MQVIRPSRISQFRGCVFVLVFVCSLATVSRSPALGQTETATEQAKQSTRQVIPQDTALNEIPRPKLFDDPYDFSQPPVVPTIEGPSPSEIQASIDRGARFLIASQNPDGSFGSHVSKRIGEIYAPLPGSHHAFRAATTATFGLRFD